MAGWRIGFAVGNKVLIQALSKIKSYVDYGAFTPVQVAGTAALNGPQECVNEIRKTYKDRRDLLIRIKKFIPILEKPLLNLKQKMKYKLMI